MIVCASVLALVSVAGAQPVPPHAVYGEVTRDGVAAPGSDVTALHDGSELVSTKSGTDGQYRIEIPYDSSYSGEEISLEVNSTDTGSTATFEAGETSRRELDSGGLPHLVEGYIENSTDERVDDEDIAFLDGDTEEASDSTDAEGFYSLEIPFSDDYSGENLDMSVDGEGVDKSVEFRSGGETVLNYTGEAADSSTQQDTGGDSEGSQESSEDDTQESDGSQGTGDLLTNETASLDESPEPVANISVANLETPDAVTQGSTFELEISLENSGDARGNTSNEVLLEGESVSTFTVQVPPSSSVSTTREITIEDAGNYTLMVANLTSKITIEPETAQRPRGEENSGSGPPLSLILGGLSTILFVSTIAYYIYSRGGEDEEPGDEGDSLGFAGDPRTEQHDYDVSYTDDED
jgi:hypothetical protein